MFCSGECIKEPDEADRKKNKLILIFFPSEMAHFWYWRRNSASVILLSFFTTDYFDCNTKLRLTFF